MLQSLYERSDFMFMQYKNFCIRNAEEKDVEKLVSWWNDGQIMEHAGFPNGLNITKEKVLLQLQKDTEDHRRLIVEIDNIPIGEMCYTITETCADIGIKICDCTKQNHGYGRIFLSMLIEKLFQNGCTKIVLDTMIENKRAQHVYESLGFHKTGIKIDCWKDQVGNMRTAVDYELLPANFHSYLDDVLIMDIDSKDCECIFEEMKKLVLTYEDLNSIDVLAVMEWLHKKVCNHMSWYRKIVVNHQVVGYYAVRENELEDFYILDGYRSCGIGSQIMEMIDCDTLCVFKKNVGAIAFYEKFDFEIVEEMETRYIMKRGR